MPAPGSDSRLQSDLRRELAQTLLDSDLVALCGLRAGRIVATTPAFRHLFGGDVPPDETLLERVAPEDRERVASALSEVCLLRSPPISFRAIRLDGSMLQAEMVATRARRDDGDLVVVVVSDVTERTASEEKLMLQAGFPGLESHAAEHQRLLADLRALTAHADRLAPCLVTHILRDWLVSHIASYDGALADAIKH